MCTLVQQPALLRLYPSARHQETGKQDWEKVQMYTHTLYRYIYIIYMQSRALKSVPFVVWYLIQHICQCQLTGITNVHAPGRIYLLCSRGKSSSSEKLYICNSLRLKTHPSMGNGTWWQTCYHRLWAHKTRIPLTRSNSQQDCKAYLIHSGDFCLICFIFIKWVLLC